MNRPEFWELVAKRLCYAEAGLPLQSVWKAGEGPQHFRISQVSQNLQLLRLSECSLSKLRTASQYCFCHLLPVKLNTAVQGSSEQIGDFITGLAAWCCNFDMCNTTTTCQTCHLEGKLTNSNFSIFEKCHVNGEHTHPVWHFCRLVWNQ